MTATAGSVASSAFVELGRANNAALIARNALQTLPPDIVLKPREAVEVGLLKLRAGDVQGARNIVQRLRSIGYRYPAFVRSRLATDTL